MTEVLAQLDVEPSKEQTIEYLKKLREEFLEEIANGKSAEELAESMGEKVFNKGVITMKGAALTVKATTMGASVAAATAAGTTAGAAATSVAVPGPLGILAVGVIYSAQTGIDYRKFKKGLITHDEFKTRAKRGAFASTGGVLGSAGGMVGGFFVGQALIPIPVVGGVIGTFAGGMAGGLGGAKVSIKLYERMEAKMQARREQALSDAAL